MLGIMCKKRVTRHDYALDYRMDFSAYIFTTAISTKTCTFSSGTGTRETLYLGAKQAPQRYRIYDKALESKSTGTLWRIEEQMRFKPSDAWQLHLPFANLVTFQTYPTLPVLDRLLLDGLHRNPDEWGALPRRAKERLRSVIKNAPPVAHLNPNPYEAYLALCQEYVDYIHLHTKG
jgi:hypothetical protein